MNSGILYPMPDTDEERRCLRMTLTLHNAIGSRYRRRYHIDILTVLGLGIGAAAALLLWI